MKILLSIKMKIPLPRLRGYKYLLGMGAEGVSERQWRSAANRPSRQARQGVGLIKLTA